LAGLVKTFGMSYIRLFFGKGEVNKTGDEKEEFLVTESRQWDAGVVGQSSRKMS
jgi:hypothetical protein